MPAARHLPYLEALGIDVYVRRGTAPQPGVPVAEDAAPLAVAAADPPRAVVVPEVKRAGSPALSPGVEASLDWEPLRERGIL